MEKLRDIKPLVEIPDYSFYLYILVMVVVTLLAALMLFFLIRKLSKKRLNQREQILQHLRSLSFDNPKEVAYQMTKYGRYLVKDESSARLYEDLVRKLTKYKYKKDVEPLDDEIKKEIKLFLRVYDERF